MFCKEGVLENFGKFTGKHLCQSLSFNKVAGGVWSLIGMDKKDQINNLHNILKRLLRLRIKKHKYKPAGDWRTFTQIKMNYSLIAKHWIYNDLNYKQVLIVPFKMLKTIDKLYIQKNVTIHTVFCQNMLNQK